MLSVRCTLQFMEYFSWIRVVWRATATEWRQNLPQIGACRLQEWFFKHTLSLLAVRLWNPSFTLPPLWYINGYYTTIIYIIWQKSQWIFEVRFWIAADKVDAPKYRISVLFGCCSLAIGAKLEFLFFLLLSTNISFSVKMFYEVWFYC